MTTSFRKSRRDFLRLSGLTTLAACIPGPLLNAVSKVTATRTEGAPMILLPWETNSALLAGSDKNADHVLKLGRQYLTAPGRMVRNEFPTLFADSSGIPWLAYTDYTDLKSEKLVLSSLSGNQLGTPQQISGNSDHSAIMAQGLLLGVKDYALVWASCISPQNWAIKASVNGKLFERLNAEGTIGTTPSIAVDKDGTIWVAYEETLPKQNTRVMLTSLRKGSDHWSRSQELARRDEGDCRRPALAAAKEGGIWYALDCYTGQFSVNIELGRWTDTKKVHDRIQVTNGPGLNIAPALTVDRQGHPWLAWHSNITPEGNISITRWFKLAMRKSDGEMYEPSTPSPGRDYEATGEVQGFEFPKLISTQDGRIWITGRASQNFMIQCFGPEGWSDLVRFPKDGWGGRGQTLEVTATKDGKMWTARRDLQNLVLQEILPAPAKAFNRKAYPLKTWQWPTVKPTMLKKPKFPPQGNFNFYFGDIHGHTWHSDGTSDVDEYFIMRRDFYGEDFCSLTDHDNFVGNPLSPTEFEYLKEITAHFNNPGHFATIFGQEWTSGRPPSGDGHHNIYSLDRDVPLFDHFLPETDRLHKFTKVLKEKKWLALPHHVGWTGIDWDTFDAEVTPVMEIISVHGAYEFFGNKPIMHRAGDAQKKWFAQDGWAIGKKFGVIGGTDCHGLKHQHGVCWKEDPYRSGWTVILAQDLTPESIFDALKNRRCYATSGIFMRIEFELNGHLMGEECSLEAGENPTIQLDVSGESPIELIEIVRNNKTVYATGGNGRRSTVTWCDDAPLTGESWYYIRITCRDGNMAWTTPVWMTVSDKEPNRNEP